MLHSFLFCSSLFMPSFGSINYFPGCQGLSSSIIMDSTMGRYSFPFFLLDLFWWILFRCCSKPFNCSMMQTWNYFISLPFHLLFHQLTLLTDFFFTRSGQYVVWHFVWWTVILVLIIFSPSFSIVHITSLSHFYYWFPSIIPHSTAFLYSFRLLVFMHFNYVPEQP